VIFVCLGLAAVLLAGWRVYAPRSMRTLPGAPSPNSKKEPSAAEPEPGLTAPVTAKAAPFGMRGDRPIESAEEDRLGRAPFAKAMAAQILEAPALDSYVVAIMGPWGSGKTSIVNMIAEEVKLRSDAVVMRFNPWIFSGTEQLVGFFFRELGAQFSELRSDRLSAIGASLKRYAGLFGSVVRFVPTVGGALKEAAEIAKTAGETLAEPPSVESQRDKIREQLKGQDQRIVVLVDDIDRLRRDEIREVVKLVRLTGDFPNIVYVLAFDRGRVEAALGDDDETGRSYLEKIVQVAYDVPIAQEADVAKLLVDELNAAMTGIEHGPFQQGDWNDVFAFVLRPLLRSPRDVRRYVNALPTTLRVIGREVALADVLALEAVRTFLPDVFAKLPGLIDVLTSRRDGLARRDNTGAKPVQQLVEMAGPHREAVTQFLRRLFPHSARFLGGPTYGDGYEQAWERGRRVALADVLRFYLERRLPEGAVGTAQVEAAFAMLGDRTRLAEMLDKLDAASLENLFHRLEVFQDEFPAENVEAAVGAIQDQYGRLRAGREHIFDLGAEMALDRVVLRLLRRIESEPDREAVLGRLLPSIRSISGERALVRVCDGHKLAPPSAIAQWKLDVMQRFKMATDEQLRTERHLGELLAEAIEAGGDAAEKARGTIADDRMLIVLLVSVLRQQSSWTPGSATSVQEPRLPWQDLGRLFGEEALARRVREVRAQVKAEVLDPRSNTALDTAARYANGWRPNDRFGSEEPHPSARPDASGHDPEDVAEQ
jgi:predicted KAP-like P-loop ATPase